MMRFQRKSYVVRRLTWYPPFSSDDFERVVSDFLNSEGEKREELQKVLAGSLSRFIWREAYRLSRRTRHEADDLFQEGFLGTYKAFNSIDKDKIGTSRSYVMQNAEWAMLKYVKDTVCIGRVIRFPVSLQTKKRAIEQVEAKYQTRFGEQGKDESILEEARRAVPGIYISSEALFLAREQNRLVRFEHSENDVDRGDKWAGAPTLGESLGETHFSHVALLDREQIVQRFRSALALLTEPQRQIIQKRFGLDGHQEHTLQQLAEMLGVCRERVRQRIQAILVQLRESIFLTEEHWPWSADESCEGISLVSFFHTSTSS